MWVMTVVLLGAGGLLLVRAMMQLTASSRYSFRNRTLQRQRMNAIFIGILSLMMLAGALYIFVGK
ncbi:hypothetical protein ACFQPF_14455 [Fictibacillus iocasae]|uniref:HIG1 domain-containing protein n=1 Tax=Fictibacillus iocasae TaxID=2715437 RepID=A0ABW2NU55_9BACL